MKIDMSDGAANRFLLSTVNDLIQKKDPEKKLDKLDYSDGAFTHDVVLKIDGIEFDIMDFVHDYERRYNDAVKAEAGKMYLATFNVRSDEIIELLEDISDRLRKIRREKFPDIRFDDDPSYLYD